GRAALAGLLAGLAMQTKYTGFLAPGVMLLHAGLLGRRRLGLLAAALAVVLFVGWGAWVAQRYGASHFLFHLRQRGPLVHKFRLMLPLFCLLGALAPAAALLGLIALGASRKAVASAAVAVALGYAAVAFGPAGGLGRVDPGGLVFGLAGACTAGIALGVARG